jgi:circadian clock protein KaiC
VRGTDRDKAAEALRDREVGRTKLDIGVIGPTSSLIGAERAGDARAMILRLVDLLSVKGITAMFSSLTHGDAESAATGINISSLMDRRLTLKKESNGEHNRQLYRLKSHGMPHSNPVRDCITRSERLLPHEVYIGSQGIRIGSARVAQEARKRAWTGTGRRHGPKLSSTRMRFDLESNQHEKTSRGFAGL